MAPADPVLVEVVRDGFVESVHRGRVVALDADGGRPLSLGDVDAPVLVRSCLKPLQATAMVRAGLDVPDRLLAIACASHDGTPEHLDAVRALLATAGLDEAALANTPGEAIHPEAAARQRLGSGPDRLHHNCSGKHAGMLATCVAHGWPLDGYLRADHPLQRHVLATVEELTGAPIATVATDGCGAPIPAIPLAGLARAYARIATAPARDPEGRVAAAMRAHPDLVGGRRRDDSTMMRSAPGLLAKLGAEGCFAAACTDGRAVAVKVADGASRAAAPVAIAALRRLGVPFDRSGDRAGDGAEELERFAAPPVLGHGRPVGALRVVLGTEPDPER